MSQHEYPDLGSVVVDERFPPTDLALRRGRHFNRDEIEIYEFLLDAQPFLEPFYQRYGCELMHQPEGYFYLLPVGDALPRRSLSGPEMIVGQALALCWLSPANLENQGLVTREELLTQLSSVMGPDTLLRAFNPKRKRLDERLAQQTVRQRVAEALRKLSSLGFIDLVEGDTLKLHPCLMRFAEPVQGAASTGDALKTLIAKGQVEDPAQALGDGLGEERLGSAAPTRSEGTDAPAGAPPDPDAPADPADPALSPLKDA